MARRGFNARISRDLPLLDIHSAGRALPDGAVRFSSGQLDQIRRTVRKTPEVMVKVTGGARSIRAAAAHLSYISHDGRAELEAEDGGRIAREGQRQLLRDWHLELATGQYRTPANSGAARQRVKLVHNIVLSMPAPTPPAKVLAAARAFARERFALQHRYVMALHTHQEHPHVHLAVKAEAERSRRLHIDKAMLREWREDFAQKLREQGIAANATRRVARGQTKRAAKDAILRAQRRAESHAVRRRAESVAREILETRTIADPARKKLLDTRKAVIAVWDAIAAGLEAQGEVTLGAEVRYFAMHLPPVLTDRERLARELIRLGKSREADGTRQDDRVPDRTLDRSR